MTMSFRESLGVCFAAIISPETEKSSSPASVKTSMTPSSDYSAREVPYVQRLRSRLRPWLLAWADWLKTPIQIIGDTSWLPPNGKTEYERRELARIAARQELAAAAARIREVRKQSMVNLRVFGPCRREGCEYRAERCRWGFCGECCFSYHRGQYRHDSDSDKAPPLHRPHTPPKLPLAVPPAAPPPNAAYHATPPASLLPANAAPEPEPEPVIRPLAEVVETTWPPEAHVYAYAKGVEELLKHPLYVTLTKQGG